MSMNSQLEWKAKNCVNLTGLDWDSNQLSSKYKANATCYSDLFMMMKQNRVRLY